VKLGCLHLFGYEGSEEATNWEEAEEWLTRAGEAGRVDEYMPLGIAMLEQESVEEG